MSKCFFSISHRNISYYPPFQLILNFLNFKKYVKMKCRLRRTTLLSAACSSCSSLNILLDKPTSLQFTRRHIGTSVPKMLESQATFSMFLRNSPKKGPSRDLLVDDCSWQKRYYSSHRRVELSLFRAIWPLITALRGRNTNKKKH